MPASNSTINLATLDFDSLKSNLRSFLSSQSTFKDYDYAGSNMNVLLDVLSYNTYMNAFYLNMAVSEMFLDSAQLRSSVVSHAKMLNYTPRSSRSSKASVNVSIPVTNEIVTLTIPKGTSFSGRNVNGNYTFSTDKTMTLLSGNGTFTTSNLEIYEGSYSQEAFVVDHTQEVIKFPISSAAVDVTSMIVYVTENSGQDVSQFLLAENLYGLNANSNVYFLQTDIDGRYEILFGDNVFGRKPLNGALVNVEYRTSSGSDANGVDTFALEIDLGSINGTEIDNGLSVVTVQASINGANAESIESVRYNAPRHFQTQERAVTTQDYVDLILSNFQDVESVSAFGGEEVSDFGNVDYGKVYVSCSTYSGSKLTSLRKRDVENFLRPRAVLGITPVLIDPEYIYLTILSRVHVDFGATTLTADQIKTAVIQSIDIFNTNNLMVFDADFRMSALMSEIDSIDGSILSNETNAFMYKKFNELSPSVPTPLTVNYYNPIAPGSVISNQFYVSNGKYIYTDYIKGIDNSGGNLYRLEKTSTSTVDNYTLAGKIDYKRGIISIISSTYDSVPSGGLRIFATPINQDIYSVHNNILEIDTATGLSINVVSG